METTYRVLIDTLLESNFKSESLKNITNKNIVLPSTGVGRFDKLVRTRFAMTRVTSFPIGFPEMNLRPSEHPARLDAHPDKATTSRVSGSDTDRDG